MDNEEKFSFRDQAALKILVLLNQEDKSNSIINYFYSFNNAERNDEHKWSENIMEKRIRFAYHLADMIRKVRLEVFK